MTLNLQRIAGNANEYPPSFRSCSIISTASPLHPNEPKTPQGFDLVSLSWRIKPIASCSQRGESSQLDQNNSYTNVWRQGAECNINKGVTWTGVGMWPPRVGLPITKPLQELTTDAISSLVQTSAFIVSHPTPAFVIPRLWP